MTHPVFELESFRSASVDGFWVSVAVDEADAAEQVAEALRELGARAGVGGGGARR